MKGKSRGLYAGRGMHIEYHTTKPKKKKAADCIYLTDSRECQNKASPCYLAKCFMASYCTFKVKAKDATVVQKPAVPITPVPKPVLSKKEPQIVKIQCTLPMNCKVYHPQQFGNGEYTSYDAKRRSIGVTFNGKEVKFLYPDAIFSKHLIVPKFAFEIVLRDLHEAEKK